MEYMIGLLLAMALLGITTHVGIGRGRNYYPILLIVIASYYVLFAAMLSSRQTLLLEAAMAGVFMLVAIIGFKTNLWIVAVALVSHGLFDSVHHLFIDNPGVPVWWPGFCSAFDLVAGGFLAVLLIKRPHSVEWDNHFHCNPSAPPCANWRKISALIPRPKTTSGG